MEPPFKVRAFEDMTLGEATAHFHWFVSQSPVRQALLARAFEATSGQRSPLDYTAQSLVPLWAWASSYVSAEKIGDPEARSLPGTSQVLKLPPPLELSIATKALAVDIGFYVAELLIRRSSRVRWVLWREHGHAWNRPALDGLALVCVPSDIVVSCCWSTVYDGKNEQYLYDTFLIWSEDVQPHRSR